MSIARDWTPDCLYDEEQIRKAEAYLEERGIELSLDRRTGATRKRVSLFFNNDRHDVDGAVDTTDNGALVLLLDEPPSPLTSHPLPIGAMVIVRYGSTVLSGTIKKAFPARRADDPPNRRVVIIGSPRPV